MSFRKAGRSEASGAGSVARVSEDSGFSLILFNRQPGMAACTKPARQASDPSQAGGGRSSINSTADRKFRATSRDETGQIAAEKAVISPRRSAPPRHGLRWSTTY